MTVLLVLAFSALGFLLGWEIKSMFTPPPGVVVYLVDEEIGEEAEAVYKPRLAALLREEDPFGED